MYITIGYYNNYKLLYSLYYIPGRINNLKFIFNFGRAFLIFCIF